MEIQARIAALTQALQGPLPGESAKASMRPTVPRAGGSRPGADVLLAAVLVLLYPRSATLALPLMLRRRVEGDVHGGQISLPGGQKEGSESPEETALREAREELGIPPADVQILGRLSQQWIPVSGYLVQPIVGHLERAPRLTPDPREVESVLETSVEELMLPERRSHFVRDLAGEVVSVPCWRLDGGILWGATAMILAELLALLERSMPG